jgi:tRNA(fMet)-specific endonuclease VapC
VKYLLDTNICGFIIRQKLNVVLQRFNVLPPSDVAISTITVAELRYGTDKCAVPTRNQAAIASFLAPLAIVDFDSPATIKYGRIRSFLERQGKAIGPLDTRIAAHERSLNLIVVTANTSEFSRVPGLQCEDWTKTQTSHNHRIVRWFNQLADSLRLIQLLTNSFRNDPHVRLARSRL